jgi:hypothetical protein
MTEVVENVTQAPSLPYRPRAREHLAKAHERLADGNLHCNMGHVPLPAHGDLGARLQPPGHISL